LKAFASRDGLFGLAYHALVLRLGRIAGDALGMRSARRVLEPGVVCAVPQPAKQVVESFGTPTVIGRQVFGQRDIGDGLDRASQVVEYQQRVDHEQVGQR
jgi:hypothetical protein